MLGWFDEAASCPDFSDLPDGIYTPPNPAPAGESLLGDPQLDG